MNPESTNARPNPAGSKRIRLQRALLVVCAAFLLIGVAACAGEQKLILTDGTDQRVSTYERKGDRVRYYSTERQEWEEIPDSLVDWKATEDAANEAKKVPADLLEFEPRKPARPRVAVAPGIDLPESEGVYVYDRRNLLGLLQSQAAIKDDRSRHIIGSIAPVISGRAFVELPGLAAKIAISGSSPVFYLQLSQLSPAGYGLVKMSARDGSRVVGEISIKPLTKSQAESQQTLPITVETVAPAAGNVPAVIRLSPKEPLRPGEYAIVEYAEKGKMNLFVWDFGVHHQTP